MPDINEIMYLLDWNRTEEEQRRGLALARTVKCASAFFQPAQVDGYGGKPTWDNCALVLSERSDEELMPYVSNLFDWLQDMNWPGAEIILERLRRFDSGRDYLAVEVRRLIDKLIAMEDTGWMYVILCLLEDDGPLARAVGSEARRRLLEAYEKED